jgi:hypothetical protein
VPAGANVRRELDTKSGETIVTDSNNNSTAAKPTFKLKSVTVSLEIADKSYGDGNSGSTQISAWVNDASLDQLPDVVDASLDMFLSAWLSLIGAKVMANLLPMKAAELQDTAAKVRRRLEKVRTLLRGDAIDPASGGATQL